MSDYQSRLFQIVKESIPTDHNLVDEIADLLSVSTDSAYRRIRGQTALTLDESQKIAREYNVSIDALFGSETGSVTFAYRALQAGKFDFKSYLENILNDLNMIRDSEESELIYMAKDLPLFYHFHSPELTSFKIFFWLKTFMRFPEYENAKFLIANYDKESFDAGKKILEVYTLIPSIEIWNDETINSFLRQIEFYHVSGLFVNPSESIILCNQLIELIDLIKMQAEKGRKLTRGKEVANEEHNYQLYYNELTLVDNTVFVRMNGRKFVYLTHNLLNNLITTNVAFCEETHNIVKNTMNKASLISSSSEKERNIFFRRMTEKIEALKTRLQAGS